jgi:hypothetical protein
MNMNHHSCNKKLNFAWRKYYALLEQQHERKLNEHQVFLNTKLDLPLHVQHQLKQYYELIKENITCPICLEIVQTDNVMFSSCGHLYCKEDFEKIKESAKCAVCRSTI